MIEYNDNDQVFQIIMVCNLLILEFLEFYVCMFFFVLNCFLFYFCCCKDVYYMLFIYLQLFEEVREFDKELCGVIKEKNEVVCGQDFEKVFVLFIFVYQI